MPSDGEKKGRGPGIPFTGGNDPRRNAAGRMKGVEKRFREVAETREYTAADGQTYRGLDALAHVLLDIAYSSKEQARDRRTAVDSYVDRGWGKAKQTIEVSEKPADTGRRPDDMSDEEIAEALDAIHTLRKLGAVSADGDDGEVSEH
jgi:hypothetical protein